MVADLVAVYKRLIQSTTKDTHRRLFGEFSIDNRITGLIGPRGTGKTTLLLQYINEKVKEKDRCMYVSLDHIYFSSIRLIDFVNELYDVHGTRIFFLDEVHKYADWGQELKNIHDSYPDVKLVFSGSSSIDLIKGSYDLSRRVKVYRLGGLSFREYLDFRGVASLDCISMAQLFENKAHCEEQIAAVDRIRGHFKEYLSIGYYPFFLEDVESYGQKLFRVVEKTIYEDIAHHYQLKTENLKFFKIILAYLASIPPGELSRNSIAKNIGLDNKTVHYYLGILQENGLVRLISSQAGGSAVLKQKEKIYLENSNLYQIIAEKTGHAVNRGTVREVFFLSMMSNAGFIVHYSDIGDFVCNDVVYEIGGKGKTLKQLAQTPSASFLVKDDILYGSNREIPLHLFGFLY